MQRMISNVSGVAAIEFAAVGPVFVLILVGIIGYGVAFGIQLSVQQLVASAARASIPGLSDEERTMLATQYVEANAGSYPLLDPGRLSVSVSPHDQATRSFSVQVTYDATNSAIYSLDGVLPLPGPQFRNSAAIQRGGY